MIIFAESLIYIAMAIKQYHQNNFHKYTFCIFQEVDFLAIADLKLSYKSKSGSSYYFTKNGVYRLSNHWGRAANCKWRLLANSKKENSNSNRTKLGFANWTDFYPDNDLEKLYFIEADFENKTVNFYHKQSEHYSEKKMLRTASETTKLIKQIRMLLEENSWMKYLKENNPEYLRQAIIEELINSNKTFQEVRKAYL